MTPWSRAEAEKVSVKDFINMPIADLAKGTRLYDGQYNAEERSIIKKAKSDGTYMKAPNGKPTNLDERQWVQVRTKAFKKWFGDWEKAARIEKLRDSEPIKVTFNNVYPLDRKSAKEWMKSNIKGSYVNKQTGEEIQISNIGINEVASHGSMDEAHLESLSAIPSMIENSIFIDEIPNAKGNDKYDSYRYYVCGIIIDGQEYTAKIVIGVKGDSKYYDHRLSNITKGSLIDTLNRLSNSVDVTKEPSLFDVKDTKLVSILQTDSSKVVDENGEPKVVYHGRSAEFSTFERKEGSRFVMGLEEKVVAEGFFFSPDKKFSEEYANNAARHRGGKANVVPCFLNIRRPMDLTSDDFARVYEDVSGWAYNVGMDSIDNLWEMMDEEGMAEKVREKGYDGAIFVEEVDESYEPIQISYCVLDTNQIKSATTNSGEFSTENDDIRFSIVTDKEEIDRLNSEPTIKVYRAMQLVDGKLYPPMSGKVNGKWRDGISVEDLGKVWEKAEENPELADDKGRFVLNKGNGTTLKARYNPYIHTSTTPLNDQFSSAQSRPELVTVEVEIPKSELTSGYKADKAKDRVGKVEWKAGVIQSKLSGTRTVILSRWDKPMRIVPESEVADKIVEMFDGKDVTMPSNVVTPALRAELEKIGVPFVETDNQGRIKAEEQDVVDILSDGTRFRIVGGNSGYVGYSMSKRAAEAKEKGRFPKTQFVKEYG